jgi:hypothetical protein
MAHGHLVCCSLYPVRGASLMLVETHYFCMSASIIPNVHRLSGSGLLGKGKAKSSKE